MATMSTSYPPVKYEWAVEAEAFLTDAPEPVRKEELEPWNRPGLMTVERVRLRWHAHGPNPVPSLSVRLFGHNVRKDGSPGAPINIGLHNPDKAPEWLREALANLRARAELQMGVQGVNLR